MRTIDIIIDLIQTARVLRITLTFLNEISYPMTTTDTCRQKIICFGQNFM